MSTIAKEFFHRRADITITGVNIRVVLAFVVGTTMHRVDAWFESLVQAFFG